MKFLAIASVFSAFAVASIAAAPHKRHLRKLSGDQSFLGAKPEDERCYDGTWDCTCRDGSSCRTTQQCINRGASGSCSKREESNDKSARMTCRNGDFCTHANTACADGSKCKERNGFHISFDKTLDQDADYAEVEAKPASEACQDGDLRCTCRDGTVCRTTDKCTKLGVGGSCSYRPPNRNSNKSCRNGESCINNNTACRDGSKCKERDGFLVTA